MENRSSIHIPYVSDARRNVDRIRGKASISITQLGKQKAEAFAGSGPSFDVLATLHEKGPCSFGELVRQTGFDESKVKHIVMDLRSEGYVSVQRIRE